MLKSPYTKKSVGLGFKKLAFQLVLQEWMGQANLAHVDLRFRIANSMRTPYFKPWNSHEIFEITRAGPKNCTQL